MGIIAREIELWSVDKPKPWPGNPRRGDVDLIAESIEANGFYAPIIVQKSSGYVIAGNHRLAAARQIRMPEVPCVVVDVDDDRARKMVLVDNRPADQASYDTDRLLEMLDSLDGDYVGTGWDEESVAGLLEPKGVPLPDEGDADTSEMLSGYGVIIECSDEAEQRTILDEQMALGRSVRTLS